MRNRKKRNWSFLLLSERRLKTKQQFKYKLGTLLRPFVLMFSANEIVWEICLHISFFTVFWWSHLALRRIHWFTYLHIMRNKTVDGLLFEERKVKTFFNEKSLINFQRCFYGFSEYFSVSKFGVCHLNDFACLKRGKRKTKIFDPNGFTTQTAKLEMGIF